MKELSYEHFFATLSNPGRLNILHTLSEFGPMNVTDLSEKLGLEQSAVSHCLKRLLLCHFVEVKQSGKERNYSVNEDTIRPLLRYMKQHVEKYCVENCKH